MSDVSTLVRQTKVLTKEDFTSGRFAPLTAMERCDRCGAQAYLVATNATGSVLKFCGHHGRAHESALNASGFDVVDYTITLKENTKPDGGSAAG